MTKSILFIFLDYPPKSGPGAQRNFYLNKHFSQLGWQTKVLTITIKNKEVNDNSCDDKEVIRAYGKDATQVFSIKGKYPKFIEIPDRWYLWILPAIIKGYKAGKNNNFNYIYASFPSYSSTIVGTFLSKILNKPLIVDLRDPFRFRYDPENMPVHWLYRWLEKKTITQASLLITTTPECSEFYSKLYPEFPSNNIHVIHNGFAKEFHDEFEVPQKLKSSQPFTLLHSGILYQIGRNPDVLLKAIHFLVSQGEIKKGQFILRFRGANIWPALSLQIDELGLTDFVEFKERISYTQAIEEMSVVSANVLIQNSLFNLQVPSKLYDILALKKSLLAITDKQGALAKEMTHLDLPYFSSTVEETVILLRKLMNVTPVPLTNNSLNCRNRYNMNQKLSKTLNSFLKPS